MAHKIVERTERTGEISFGKFTVLNASGKINVGSVNTKKTRSLSITARVTYNASATSGVKVNTYFSADGHDFDTVPYTFFTIDLTADSVVQETHLIDVPENGMLRIELENVDSTYTATDITVWITEVKYEFGKT